MPRTPGRQCRPFLTVAFGNDAAGEALTVKGPALRVPRSSPARHRLGARSAPAAMSLQRNADLGRESMSNRKARLAQRINDSRHPSRRLFLEPLEDRRLLAFLAPVDYPAGAAADGHRLGRLQ